MMYFRILSTSNVSIYIPVLVADRYNRHLILSLESLDVSVR